MPNIIRAAAAVVFFIAMTGAHWLVKAVVDMGFVPWLALMAAIFWLGIKIENDDRKADGRPPYAWSEARELVMPLGWLAAILLIAYALR